MDLADLREANVERCKRWHPPESIPWTGADWSNAMAGEAGEMAEALEAILQAMLRVSASVGKAGNIVKKLRREETGTANQGDPSSEELRHNLANEIADVIIYADLLAHFYGIDLSEAVISKFDAVSERMGFPERLGGDPNPPDFLMEACQRLYRDQNFMKSFGKDGFTAADFLQEIQRRWPKTFPLVSVIDVADCLNEYLGSPRG